MKRQDISAFPKEGIIWLVLESIQSITGDEDAETFPELERACVIFRIIKLKVTGYGNLRKKPLLPDACLSLSLQILDKNLVPPTSESDDGAVQAAAPVSQKRKKGGLGTEERRKNQHSM